MRSLKRYRRVLRLRFDEPVDVVLTTTDVLDHEVDEDVNRCVTTEGNIRGAMAFANGLSGRFRGNGALNLQLDKALSDSPERDLIVIGGPKQNEVAKRVLEALKESHPTLSLIFDDGDQRNARVALGDCSVAYRFEKDETARLPRPKEDYALIVMWVNPLAGKRRRLIWCAGITSSGTEAAARYLVRDVLPTRFWRRVRSGPRSDPTTVSALRPLPWRWPCFAMVIHVQWQGGQRTAPQELALVPLQLPVSLPHAILPPRTTEALGES